MRRKQSAFVRCHWDGCKDTAHFEYDTQREYRDGTSRRENYFCSIHRDYGKTLRPDNQSVTLMLSVVERNGNKYWSEPDKLHSGFVFGEGFVASADMFDIGSVIKITAEVVKC